MVKKSATVSLETDVYFDIEVYCAECGAELETKVDTGPLYHKYKNAVVIEVEPCECKKGA